MKTCALTTSLVICLCLPGCSDFVHDVDGPGNIQDESILSDEGQFVFLMNGVQQRFATSYGLTVFMADALSDMLVLNTRVQGNNTISFQTLENGQIPLNDPLAALQFRQVSELRFLADDLLSKASSASFSDQNLRRQLLFTGNFYGAIARYLYATYTGLTEREGGGVLNAGPFIPAEQMYQRCLTRLAAASEVADSYEQRLVNSLRARVYLFLGNSAAAMISAQNGLQQGDEPLQALYGGDAANSYWKWAGEQETSFLVAPRFIGADSTDNRIRIEPLPGSSDPLSWRQAKYAQSASPITFLSWQETELVLAELLFSAGNVNDALGHINNVRRAAGVGERKVLDLDVLVQEREQALFLEGLRLVDQRRYNRFHLPAGTWQYFPVPEEERIRNPNFD